MSSPCRHDGKKIQILTDARTEMRQATIWGETKYNLNENKIRVK